ncbi:MAG TPA: tRNA (adenosine(37)-N6)-dimethylallyltransferase MiaA [Ohtaekwangia sp.]|uniref:tRNA (adenosine(37)-N6)-dimethylallyltransferase MiaA n=1 Tax=Ohtaekwangia sp. TaxID=2066019 RepID=UPI002F937A98
MKEHKLIVIVGPTAVGKTAVAIQVAEHLGTEIISADSRQIYRELTIGTAKPDEAELKRVPHHFIDSHSIKEDYDAASYGRDALSLIHRLFEQHKFLVLCGGSGLYVKAVLEGFDEIPDVPDEIREHLTKNFEQHGIVWLQEQMCALDPEHFAALDQQNPHRLMRALEVKIGTGQSIASFRKQAKLQHPFEVIKIGLELPREELYSRIDARMDQMVAAGLFDEATQLYAYRHHNALQTVGYQEIFDYMDGKYDREEAVRLLKRNSRRYAKRQLTWFKRDEETLWMNPGNIQAILNLIN